MNNRTKLERCEIADIIAESFDLNGEKFSSGDFEWSAYQLQEAGYGNVEKAKQEVARIVLDDFIIELHKKIPKRFLDNKAVCHIVLNIIDAVHKKLSWKYIGERDVRT